MKELLKVPTHVAIIMDGNGRWATERAKNRSYGHYQGFKTFEKLAKYIFKKGIKVLSVYAFSTENFKRDTDEVSYLMNLFIDKFGKGLKELEKNGVRIVFSGSRDNKLPKEVIKVIKDLESRTKANSNGILNICINYGGHLEIVDATKKIAEDVATSKLKIEDINEEVFSKYLYNDLPPIDLLIRTGKECRVSNYMLWQLAYAELYFSDIYFPDFNNKEFDKVLQEYNNRDRRYGAINKKKQNNAC